MPSKQWYVLPGTQVTDESTQIQQWVPKYLDRSDVLGSNGGWVPAPDSFPRATTTDGEVYLGIVEAEQSAHDAAAGASDVWTVGPNGDVSPQQVAQYLNAARRPPSLDDPRHPDEYRHLFPAEWADRLGGSLG